MITIFSTRAAAIDRSQARTALGKTAIVIPTCNAGAHWNRLHAALQEQILSSEQVLIVDSTSRDGTPAMAERAGYAVKSIPQKSFRHGATRQMAVDSIPWAEYFIFLTQDAIPSGDDAFLRLLSAFDDPEVGASYGRQLARSQANAIERHGRLFNYPDSSELRTIENRRTQGIKAAFFSNSFAAYRRSALEKVGGFPRQAIVSEEVSVAAYMLIAGWKIAYRADATAVHSHGLSIGEEFSRYFDIGVQHGREKWLLDLFGGAGGEGRLFVRSQIEYLRSTQPGLIPEAMLRNLSKWLSYHLGLRQRLLGRHLSSLISAQPNCWRQEASSETAGDMSESTYLDTPAFTNSGPWSI